jgi:hypothetical protein
MATFVATRHSPLTRYYQRLLARGKPVKVARVAAMRKLLTVLNDMVHRNEPWRLPAEGQKKEAAPQLSPVQGGLACSMHH